MNGSRSSRTRIPSRKNTDYLKSDLGTSSTSENASVQFGGGTDPAMGGIRYVEMEPVQKSPQSAKFDWWAMFDRFGALLGVLGTLVVVAIFFWSLDSKVSDVKSDVKEVKAKVDKQESVDLKQSSTLDNISSSVQRLETEVRRTQDYVHEKRR